MLERALFLPVFAIPAVLVAAGMLLWERLENEDTRKTEKPNPIRTNTAGR